MVPVVAVKNVVFSDVPVKNVVCSEPEIHLIATARACGSDPLVSGRSPVMSMFPKIAVIVEMSEGFI